MLISPSVSFHCTLRAATLENFDFAEALTRTNMGVYYRRYGLTWCAGLFLAGWQLSENCIVERNGQRIGVLRISNEGDALHSPRLATGP